MAEVVVRFWGLIVVIYSNEGKHHRPHIHVTSSEHTASIAINNGEILAGSLPNVAHHAAQALIKARRNELLKAWDDVRAGRKPTKISFVPK